MTTIRNSLLGACLALPLAPFAGHAQAAQPDGGRTIYVPAEATVIILPGAVAAPNVASAEAPEGVPMMRLIAQQEAAMQRMMADMNAMFPPMPDPNVLLRAAFGAGAAFNMAIMPVGGHGVCSESISIVESGNGVAPIVKTSQSGDACGAFGVSKPQGVNEASPVVPVTPLHAPRLVEASYPPHLVPNGPSPRS
jgi:hypothetical protein